MRRLRQMLVEVKAQVIFVADPLEPGFSLVGGHARVPCHAFESLLEVGAGDQGVAQRMERGLRHVAGDTQTEAGIVGRLARQMPEMGDALRRVTRVDVIEQAQVEPGPLAQGRTVTACRVQGTTDHLDPAAGHRGLAVQGAACAAFTSRARTRRAPWESCCGGGFKGGQADVASGTRCSNIVGHKFFLPCGSVSWRRGWVPLIAAAWANSATPTRAWGGRAMG